MKYQDHLGLVAQLSYCGKKDIKKPDMFKGNKDQVDTSRPYLLKTEEI